MTYFVIGTRLGYVRSITPQGADPLDPPARIYALQETQNFQEAHHYPSIAEAQEAALRSWLLRAEPWCILEFKGASSNGISIRTPRAARELTRQYREQVLFERTAESAQRTAATNPISINDPLSLEFKDNSAGSEASDGVVRD